MKEVGGAERIVSFPPIARADAKILILGSMPSVKSLADGFYYAHPRNCFWPMLAEILKARAPGSVAEKRELILNHRLALWDVARSCVRHGSLDSNIVDPLPNDIPGLLGDCPAIDRILFNGAASRQMFKRLIGDAGEISLITLPSTSPAYTLSVSRKREKWEEALTKGRI